MKMVVHRVVNRRNVTLRAEFVSLEFQFQRVGIMTIDASDAISLIRPLVNPKNTDNARITMIIMSI